MIDSDTIPTVVVMTFAESVERWLYVNPYRVDQLAERFSVDEPTVFAWARGEKEPLLIVQRLANEWMWGSR